MLLSLYEYICREGVVSNQQLVRAFKLDLTSLEPMLERLLDKGWIELCSGSMGCQQSCLKCETPPKYYSIVSPTKL